LGITDNNEKYYICNICSNSNDEPIQVVILVSVSESVLFIANILVIGILVIGILVNLFIGAPLVFCEVVKVLSMWTDDAQK